MRYLQTSFPPDTDEKKQIAGKFMVTQADIPKNTEVLFQTAVEAKQQWAIGQKWGAFGLCWGGKIAVLASAEGNSLCSLWHSASGPTRQRGCPEADNPAYCLGFSWRAR
jgi:dienelactone hydrolase